MLSKLKIESLDEISILIIVVMVFIAPFYLLNRWLDRQLEKLEREHIEKWLRETPLYGRNELDKEPGKIYGEFIKIKNWDDYYN